MTPVPEVATGRQLSVQAFSICRFMTVWVGTYRVLKRPMPPRDGIASKQTTRT
jgi:hypothetical protein